MRGRFSFCLVSLSFLTIACGGADVGPVAGSENSSDMGTLDESFSNEILNSSKALTNTAGADTVGVQAGYISDGTAITLPTKSTGTAYAIANCVMTAAPAFIDGSALSIRASVNTTNGVVTCKKLVQPRTEVPAEEQGCVASFTVMCVE